MPANVPKGQAPHLKLVKDRTIAEAVAGSLAADVATDLPPKPKKIREDDDLSELWDAIVPELHAAGVTSRIDWMSIEMLIRHFHAARVASDDFNVGEPTVWDEHNERPMKNPSEVVFRSESMAFMAYAKEMGMTFASRSRMPAAPVADSENPFMQDGTDG